MDEKKSLWVVVAAVAAVLVLTARGQQKTAVPADPSYREDAPSNRRQPGVDTDVSLYINHWRNSPPQEGHGGLLERDILTRGDPFQPPKKGAVLRYLKAYRRAELAPHAETREFRDGREQVFLYVMSGRGSVRSNGRSVELEEETAVVIPAGLPYRLFNPTGQPLELLLAAEEAPADFVPRKELSVGRYRDSKPVVGAHWAHIARPFIYDHEPEFANPMGFVVVSMDAFDIAQPHTHPAAAEEIWLQLKGTSLLWLGNRLLRQEPGEAFLVPPTNKSPHSSINPSGKHQQWLFFGCRK
ncbi:MAG: cupin domain-containing protein [Candidatus Aminicenantes bacterium]|nr:cupin domain-containing protein [Candidatus Aminicenantes bacterium]